MNFKKTSVALVMGAFMALSVVSPVAYAADEEAEIVVTEAGTFSNLHIWYGGVTFDGVQVTSQQSATVTETGQQIDLTDTRASSPGWRITLDAKDLEADDNPNRKIAATNLSITHSGWAPRCSDPAAWNSANPGNPTNPFQTVTASITGQTTLGSGAVEVLNATSGRGCNRLIGQFDFTLYVPSGTHTGGDSATYTGDLILTHTDGAP